MIDNRIRELIHREIDDELTPGEKAELQHYLSARQEVRDLRTSLIQADAAISELPEVDPPNGMKSAIMGQLNPWPKRPPSWLTRIGELYRSMLAQFQLRPAIPFALGTVAGIALIMIFMHGSGIPISTGEQHYVATLAHPSQHTQPILVHEFTLKQARGTIALTQSDSISWVDIRSAAAGSASIELSYDPASLKLHVLNQQDFHEVSMKSEEGTIKIDQHGEGVLSVGFSITHAEASTVRIAVTCGDERYLDSIALGPAAALSADENDQ